ncbi:MAG: endonuclease/exonuclease/phosphatase family protein [Burkholderiales bacterium]|nr:endonuclease/exonuclease/phosphatase family protein [Burkholderiales bacterium]
MKLITWNVQWGLGLDGRIDLERIVGTAREMADFDVLCLQELADNFPDLEGSQGEDQFSDLAELLLPEYRLFAAFGVDVAAEGARRRRFGNAIATRYCALSVRRHALPWPADPGKESMPRVAVEATLQTPMGAVRVVTTHLEYYSDVQRRAQAVRLRHLHDEACQRAMQPGHATTGRGPFDATPQTQSSILCGDFNFPPEHPAHAEIQQPLASGAPRYRDAWTLVHGHHPHTPTFCVHSQEYAKTPYCCDFAFVSDDLAQRVRAIEVNSETQASDHQPVLVEIDDR